MTDFPFDIVGFDLDGTLLDTSGDLAAAVNAALAADGRPALPAPRIVPMIGGGARHMLAQALDATGGHDADLLERLHDVLTDHYAAHMTVHTKPYPGVEAALDLLAARGVKLGVVTNKRDLFTRPVLEATGLAARFGCIIGGDTLGPGKGKPAPDGIRAMVAQLGGGRAAFVGDSAYDVAAARGAGLSVVACRFGFVIDADALGADAVIDSYAGLIPALEAL